MKKKKNEKRRILLLEIFSLCVRAPTFTKYRVVIGLVVFSTMLSSKTLVWDTEMAKRLQIKRIAAYGADSSRQRLQFIPITYRTGGTVFGQGHCRND